ncbi:Ig-like domain repeat protein, partial [bacterium]|nr:Ig-like domain repeat protein [bacterium]
MLAIPAKSTTIYIAALWIVLLVLGGAVASGRESIELEVVAGSYDISSNVHRLDVIHMEGFKTIGAPGSPKLPREVLDVALPPDVDWDSISVTTTDVEKSLLDGNYDIAPAPPIAAWPEGGEKIVSWGDATLIEDGKDMAIYRKDAHFPADSVRIEALSQMRKWKFVRIEFTPVAYNPMRRSLLLTTSARIIVDYDRGGESESLELLKDTVMDDLAESRFVNFDEARKWYSPSWSLSSRFGPGIPSYDYVIITTNAIEAGSSKLSSFVTHKSSQGFSNVVVITEDEYSGLTGQAPNGTAEKMRQWLINNYSYGIEYVLFIGDPDPASGDVPMKMCWPRWDEASYRESPTDYFYADLTGNWNKDGDSYFGEYGDDTGTGGVDLTAEVYVGRIPVYGGDYTTLDNILQKTMDYQNATGGLAWRDKILLPESFSDSTTDGAYLGESIMDDYLTAASFSSYKLYQQGACGANSTFSSDEELVTNATWNHWKQTANAYGLVTWWGHGSQSSASIGYSGQWCGTLLTASNCPTLDDTKPAIVYLCSCLNGYPENSGNLAFALLKSGAIAAVGASRVSWYGVGWNAPTSGLTNADLGYQMDKKMAQNSYPVGKALAIAKSTLDPSTYGELYMNAFDFNVYGDPQVHYAQAGSGNQYPVLSGGDVDPDYGKSSTTFTFSVHYDDADSDSPSVKQVYIDGAPHDMSGSGADSTYTYATSALAAGSHNYYFYFEDGNGGSDRDPDSGTHSGPAVDDTAPSSSCSSPTYSNSTSIDVDFDASDAGGSGLKQTKLYYKYESGSWGYHSIKTGASGTFSFTASLGSGTYYFQTVAEDNAGNFESAASGSGDDSTIYDATDPSSSCSSPTYSNSTSIDVDFTASDTGGSGLKQTKLYYKYESGSWGYHSTKTGASGTFSFTAADGEGMYYFQTVAEDNAGNTEAGPSGDGDDSTIYDGTVPYSSCSSSSYTNNSAITVSFNAADSGGSGLFQTKLYYKYESDSWTYHSTRTTSSGTFSFTASDGEGTYYFQTIAEDLAGNTEAGPAGSGDDATFYDITAPSSSCTSPTYGGASGIPVSFNASDPSGSGVSQTELYYKLGAGSWAHYANENGTSGSFNFVPSDGEGTYYFQTVAEDNAGNKEADPSGNGDDSTIYDEEAPSSSCTSPQYSTVPEISVDFIASDTGASGLKTTELWYSRDGGSWTLFDSETGAAGTFNFVAPSGEGVYNLQTIAEDNAGNRESGPSGEGDDSTTYDATAPQSAGASPEFANTSPIAVNFDSSDEVSGVSEICLFYRFEGGTWQSYECTSATVGSFDFEPSDGDGIYEFYTIATDNTGNVEADPVDVDDSTEYDTIAPQSSCTSPTCANASPIAVDFTASDSPSSGVAETRLFYRFNGGDWTDSELTETGTSGSIDFEPSNGEGEYEFYTIATDNAGNVEAAPGEADDSTEYDTTSPQSSCSSPTYSNSNDIAVTYNASDSGSGISSVNLCYKFGAGGSWTFTNLFDIATSGQLDFVASDGDGAYYFYTVAEDLANNFEANPSGDGDTSTIIDTAPPASSCGSPEFANSSPIAVSFTANDSSSSGIASVALWYSINGGGWTDSGLFDTGTDGAFDFIPLDGDGEYEFYTIATDNAGNVEAAPGAADDSTGYDTVAPQSSCQSPEFANSSPIAVSFTANDSSSSGIASVALWYSINGGGWTDSGLF